MKKYLPSKKFIIIMAVCLFLTAIIFMIFFMFSKHETFTAEKSNGKTLETQNQTVADLMQKDSDSDGIPDWEEALWGTDKNNPTTFNGIPDATYIGNKKKELKIDQTATSASENLTETEKFARQFFVAFTAMKASGQADQQTINNFGSALGQKIADSSLVNKYSEKDITPDKDISASNIKKYYAAMQKTFAGYQNTGMGEELNIVSNGLTSYSATGQESPSDKLISIAKAYQDFAGKIMNMPVPESLIQYHLRIANSANNTGLSVLNMAKITGDPVVGLSGLSQYQKYSDDLMAAVADLKAVLPQ